MKHITTSIILSLSISAGFTAAPTLALSQQQPSAIVGSCPKYEAAFKKFGLPVKKFSKISYRESRCNPKSISEVRKSTGRPDVGLVQISGSWATVTRNVCHVTYQQVIKALTKVNCNLAVAAYLYKNGGLGHWKATSGK
jgi:hypothetical protein